MGIDPTADYIHLGHSTNYIILKRFHDLGHKITVLVGDFTAMIGDPSDKSSLRQALTAEQVRQNLKTFKAQINKILPFDDDANPIEFTLNSKWLSKLTFEDAVDLASNFTVQQMLERDAFQKRLKDEKPLFVHEFFYPLMQGYDSVAMDVDVEVGGTDQTFNMLAGRTLLKRYKDKEKFVVATTLLENPVTGEKLMSKSLGTGVGLNESPEKMYGKTMALPDEGVVQCFVDCTYLPMSEIEDVKVELKAGANPRDIKMRLAREVVTIYHSLEAAVAAETDWLAKFSNRAKDYVPDSAETLSSHIIEQVLNDKFAGDIKKYMLAVTLATIVPQSISEANRLYQDGALKLNGQKIVSLETQPKAGDVFQVGKKNYYRIAE